MNNRRSARIVLAAAVAVVCGLMLSGCWGLITRATFDLTVTPTVISDLASGQACIFLVSFTELDNNLAAGPIALSATSSAGTVAVSPTTINIGDVAELRLNSVDAPVGSRIVVTIAGKRGGETRTATVTATVTDPIGSPDDRLVTGTTMRDDFIPWLETYHPELGIGADTVWTPLPLRPHIFEVSYYMFQSDEWELAVWWHVMIPPYDWARIYLRRRHSEIAPSFAAEISSVSSGDDPHTMDPPSEIWR